MHPSQVTGADWPDLRQGISFKKGTVRWIFITYCQDIVNPGGSHLSGIANAILQGDLRLVAERWTATAKLSKSDQPTDRLAPLADRG